MTNKTINEHDLIKSFTLDEYFQPYYLLGFKPYYLLGFKIYLSTPTQPIADVKTLC